MHYGWTAPACGNKQVTTNLTTDRYEVTCNHCKRTSLFRRAWYDNHRYPPGTKLRRIE